MSRAQPAAAAPSVTTDAAAQAIPMPRGIRWLAEDAIVVSRREEASTKGRKRKSPASGKHKPKAKRRKKAKRKQLGLDSSTTQPFWNQDTTQWSKKLPSVASNCVKKVTAPGNVSQHWFRVEKAELQHGVWNEVIPRLPTLSDERKDQQAPDLIARTFKLYPTKSTREKLRQFLGASRYAYNFGVDLVNHRKCDPKRDAWRALWYAHRKQARVKPDCAWMADIPASIT